MLQQERNNWELTQPDESESPDTHSDTLVFEVYTTTKDEIQEEEIPETIPAVSQHVFFLPKRIQGDLALRSREGSGSH